MRPFSADFRFLRTDDEIRRFLIAAREVGEAVHVLYATAILTGMRAGELAGLEWSDVDFERRLITVQRSYDGPTKADDVRYVPILDALLPDLRAWRLASGSRLAFPNEIGAMLGKSARVFQEVLRRVLKRAGFGTMEVEGRTRQYIRFHDLRHTFASHWVMKGGDLFKLQKILGHKTVQMTMRYAHLVPNAFAEDHGRFARVVVASTEVAHLPAGGTRGTRNRPGGSSTPNGVTSGTMTATPSAMKPCAHQPPPSAPPVSRAPRRQGVQQGQGTDLDTGAARSRPLLSDSLVVVSNYVVADACESSHP